MIAKIVDWVTVLNVVKEKTNKTKKQIGEEIGIGGAVIGSLSGASRLPELRHSEGMALLEMFRSVTEDKVPMVNRADEGRCACCCRKSPQSEILRVGVGNFRCISCLKARLGG